MFGLKKKIKPPPVRPFGKEGRNVSEMGLGTWQLGSDWGKVDDKKAETILRTAVDSGITFLDTADRYGDGLSETRIGKLSKSVKNELFIATKLGRGAEPGGAGNYTREAFRKFTEDSLRRLGVDALDLTQLHCLPMDVLRQGDVFEWLRELNQEGKIKHFGASVESIEEARLCMEQEGLTSLQVIFNLFRQKLITELFEDARAKNIAIIVRLPLASGVLSGKMTQDQTFTDDDHRNYNANGECFNVGETFAGIPFAKAVELAEGLKKLVPQGMTLSQMALRWILDFDAVTTIIPGARRPEQVAENVSACGFEKLPVRLHLDLHKYYLRDVEEHIRGPY